jgi:predicted DNA-binding antitoxin AbrB/MazE fold protein
MILLCGSVSLWFKTSVINPTQLLSLFACQIRTNQVKFIASQFIRTGVLLMAITIEATYVNGVLKPAQPLPLKENERVQVTVQTGLSRARQTAGLVRWTGDPALLERFIMDPELDPLEGPK